jgi:hypothetical protein
MARKRGPQFPCLPGQEVRLFEFPHYEEFFCPVDLGFVTDFTKVLSGVGFYVVGFFSTRETETTKVVFFDGFLEVIKGDFNW